MSKTLVTPALALFALLGLTACLADSGGGSGTQTAITAPDAQTWPPTTSDEFLAYIDGKSFKHIDYNDTLTFQSGTLIYSGAASVHHIATHHSPYYQAEEPCNYQASEFLIETFDSSFTFKFNLTQTNNFSPGGISNCQKHATAAGVYYESASIDLIAETDCFLYDGQKFCKQ